MNNTFYFLRHGKTRVDKNLPISKWVLSEIGEEQAKQLAQEGTFDMIDIVFSSAETKAYQTARPIADKLGKEVVRFEEISELNRDGGGFMEADEYEKTVELCLSRMDETINNWETANNALARFSRKIEDFDNEYENKNILVVGHGYTINMYFASILGLLNKTYERLNTNSFADWGIVKNHEVVRDISR